MQCYWLLECHMYLQLHGQKRLLQPVCQLSAYICNSTTDWMSVTHCDRNLLINAVLICNAGIAFGTHAEVLQVANTLANQLLLTPS